MGVQLPSQHQIRFYFNPSFSIVYEAFDLRQAGHASSIQIRYSAHLIYFERLTRFRVF